MQPTEFIWLDGTFVPWKEANVHVMTHGLHYGSGVFEGIRAYETDRGPGIFRLRCHMDRLLYSAKALALELPYSVETLCDATVELLRRNKVKHCYIRPIAYYGYGIMGLNPRNAPVQVAIACWPWGAYLPHEMVDVQVSAFIRLHPRSTVADAKVTGHYINSIQAVLPLKGTHYHEALFLDADGLVAEGPGENIFVVKNGKLFTPQPGSILPGITRATVIELARHFGIEVTESRVTLDDVLSADEAFFTGTAAEVTPIRSVNDRVLGSGAVGAVTAKLKAAYADTVARRMPGFEKYVTVV